MTVRELIERLQAFDPESKVIVTWEGTDNVLQNVEVDAAAEWNEEHDVVVIGGDGNRIYKPKAHS